jgi:hypothetical protein
MVRHWGNVLQNIPADRKAFFADGSVRGIAGRRLQSNNVTAFAAEGAARFVDRMTTRGSRGIVNRIEADANALLANVDMLKGWW